MFRRRALTAVVAQSRTAAALVLFTADAQARPLNGFSAGSRGIRTYSAPPSTATAHVVRFATTRPRQKEPSWGGRGLWN
jgi:hypothetical protein